jgi:hypothetical protein
MTGTIESRLFGKQVRIVKERDRGGQGRVLETDDPGLLIKQFEPGFITDDAARQEGLTRKVERVYRAFCIVNQKATHVELRSLPREYVCLAGKPGYLMEKAEGQLLQTILRGNSLAQAQRLALGLALARVFRLLRKAQLAHGDPHPENFFARPTPTGWIVPVIDIDGGGLLGPPGPIDPMSQPKRIYKAPELFSASWPTLRKKGLFFAPDAWALSVLLYQLLVDYEGPFCSTRAHPNPAITPYVPYAPFAYRDAQARWPKPWQEQLLKRTALPDGVISLFYQTFQNRFVLDEKERRRPTAEQWEEALTTPATLAADLKVSVLRLTPPLPVQGQGAASRGQARAHKGQTMFRRCRLRVTHALFTALATTRCAFGWCKALGATVASTRIAKAG